MKTPILVFLFCIILLIPNIGIFSPLEINSFRQRQIFSDKWFYNIEMIRLDKGSQYFMQDHTIYEDAKPSIMGKFAELAANIGLRYKIPLNIIKIILFAVIFSILLIVTKISPFSAFIYLVISSPIFIMTLINRPFFGFLTDTPTFLYSIVIVLITMKQFKKPVNILFYSTAIVLMLNHHNMVIIFLLLVFCLNSLTHMRNSKYFNHQIRLLMLLFAVTLCFYAIPSADKSFPDIFYEAFLGLNYNYWFYLSLAILIIKLHKMRIKDIVIISVFINLFFISIYSSNAPLFNIDPSNIINKSFLFFPLMLLYSLKYLTCIFKSTKRVFNTFLAMNILLSISLSGHYYAQLKALPYFVQQGFDEYWLMVFQRFVNIFGI